MFQESKLIESLQRSNLYAHDIDSFEIKETHLSWVILTGEYAYKIKKPVNFGFVDFTTLKKREHFCSLELELNKRLTDETYLAIVPIYGTEDAPSFNSDNGTIIEYAIKMRQFAQENIFDVLQENNEITIEHINSLAKQIADFHHEAKIIEPSSELGGFTNVQLSTMGNFDAFGTFDINESEQKKIAKLLDWTKTEVLTHKDLFENRKASGFVKHCHGDIHLGNIALVNNVPIIFDCIDFNDSFYWIDVINEVSFLAMDLMLRGEHNLSIKFLNKYCEHTNDYAGIALLKFYLIYRALVRAKVALYTDPTSLYPQFVKYIELADKFKNQSCDRIMITFGLSGSGKSTCAKHLSTKHNAIVIRSDIERNFICQGNMNYNDNTSDTVYENLLIKTKIIAISGFNVIVDATFLQKKHRSSFMNLANELGLNFTILKMNADEETLRDRLTKRTNDISEATPQVLDLQLKSLEQLTAQELSFCIEITSELEGMT